MKYHVVKSNDPFERDKEIHRAEIKRLNDEIIRLKLKCGEAFTSDELLRGFGNPPDMYISQAVLDRRKAAEC